jgi:hypothetical protein
MKRKRYYYLQIILCFKQAKIIAKNANDIIHTLARTKKEKINHTVIAMF